MEGVSLDLFGIDPVEVGSIPGEERVVVVLSLKGDDGELRFRLFLPSLAVLISQVNEAAESLSQSR